LDTGQVVEASEELRKLTDHQRVAIKSRARNSLTRGFGLEQP
jgi:hypothetical protein